MASRDRASHEALARIDVEQDCFVFAGRRISDLVNEIGATPFYAYDRVSIQQRVASLRKILPDAVDLHYAVKANPMPAVVRHMIGLVDGLDVASGGELAVVLAMGADPGSVSFAGPGKQQDELRDALLAGITIYIESGNEMRTLANLSDQVGQRPRVAIRVNPDFELKSSGMKMAGGAKQFGIDAEQVPGILRELASLPLEFVGFQIFSGSQNLNAESIVESQFRTLELATRLAADAPAPVRLVNLGGGFGIPYFPGETSLEISLIGERLEELLERGRRDLPDAQFIVELGRYLVGEAGVYVCRVLDKKVSRGQTFLVTNGGLHHHLAASGNFGQILRKNYPVLIGNRVVGTRREVVSVVGPLCTPLDLLADRMDLAEADIGDIVVVLQSGAYGLTASPLGFLSHPPPREVLL